jgi:hypothetical protein
MGRVHSAGLFESESLPDLRPECVAFSLPGRVGDPAGISAGSALMARPSSRAFCSAVVRKNSIRCSFHADNLSRLALETHTLP